MFLRCSFLALVVAIVCVAVIGCSSDEPMVEDIIVPEPEPEPEPEPDWVDNILTIKIGRSQTGAQLLGRFNHSKCGISPNTKDWLSHPDFPMAKRHYTIEVAVISMPEVGMTKPATTAEVQKRYKDVGRPLTMEEAIELRLQFTDQPDMMTGHEMANFFVLPSDAERDVRFAGTEDVRGPSVAPENRVTPYFEVYNNEQKRKMRPLIVLFSPLLYHPKDAPFFDPFVEVPYLAPKNTAPGARFACVISEREGYTPKTHE